MTFIPGLLGAAGITSGSLTNAKLATAAAFSFKGNSTGSVASPTDMSAADATALLNVFVGDSGSGGTQGLVPAPGAGDAAAGKFLGADGTWDAAGGGLPTQTTWSPAVNFGSGHTGQTYSNQEGYYFQFSNKLVCAFFAISLSAKGSSTGNASVTLPVAANHTSGYGGGALGIFLNMAAGVNFLPLLVIGPFDTSATISAPGAGANTWLTHASFTDTSVLSGHVIYTGV